MGLEHEIMPPTDDNADAAWGQPGGLDDPTIRFDGSPILPQETSFQREAALPTGIEARVVDPKLKKGMLGSQEIESRFGMHKTTVEGSNPSSPKYRILRAQFQEFAGVLDELLEGSREKSAMWTKLEEAFMWANKSIAKNDPIVHEEKKH